MRKFVKLKLELLAGIGFFLLGTGVSSNALYHDLNLDYSKQYQNISKELYKKERIENIFQLIGGAVLLATGTTILSSFSRKWYEEVYSQEKR